jgi:hypothetical protein
MEIWRGQLEQRVRQEPLVDYRLSSAHLSPHEPSRRPRTVLVGVGLCSRTRLSPVLPIDVLGMLLPAESIHAAVGASTLIALVADSHAETNRFDPRAVAHTTNRVQSSLDRIRQSLVLPDLQVITASSFHRTSDYLELLAEVSTQVPGQHPYVWQQIADVLYCERKWGPLLKIGWATGQHCCRPTPHDELDFDLLTKRWTGNRVGFIYCVAGRTLDPHRPKSAPYLTVNPPSRICLDASEDVQAKLDAARERTDSPLLRSTLRYYRKLTYTFSRQITRLSGPLPARLQQMIRATLAGRPLRPPATLRARSQASVETERRARAAF